MGQNVKKSNFRATVVEQIVTPAQCTQTLIILHAHMHPHGRPTPRPVWPILYGLKLLKQSGRE